MSEQSAGFPAEISDTSPNPEILPWASPTSGLSVGGSQLSEQARADGLRSPPGAFSACPLDDLRASIGGGSVTFRPGLPNLHMRWFTLGHPHGRGAALMRQRIRARRLVFG